jgi:hypothetical protein
MENHTPVKKILKLSWGLIKRMPSTASCVHDEVTPACALRSQRADPWNIGAQLPAEGPESGDIRRGPPPLQGQSVPFRSILSVSLPVCLSSYDLMHQNQTAAWSLTSICPIGSLRQRSTTTTEHLTLIGFRGKSSAQCLNRQLWMCLWDTEKVVSTFPSRMCRGTQHFLPSRRLVLWCFRETRGCISSSGEWAKLEFVCVCVFSFLLRFCQAQCSRQGPWSKIKGNTHYLLDTDGMAALQ